MRITWAMCPFTKYLAHLSFTLRAMECRIELLTMQRLRAMKCFVFHCLEILPVETRARPSAIAFENSGDDGHRGNYLGGEISEGDYHNS